MTNELFGHAFTASGAAFEPVAGRPEPAPDEGPHLIVAPVGDTPRLMELAQAARLVPPSVGPQ